MQAEGRAARRRYPSGQVIRRAPRRADDQDFGGGGTLRGSGWPGADRERDLTVERLEQCHEAINRFVVVRLVEEPIELRGRGLGAAPFAPIKSTAASDIARSIPVFRISNGGE